MPKKGELTYFQKMDEAGRHHAIDKPFSDERAGTLLMEVGAILCLLPLPPAKVLECGCGTGWFTYFLAKRGYDAVGQDVSPEAIELARAHPPFSHSPQPVFRVSDFEHTDSENEFDAVVFFASLHHAEDEQKAVHSAFRALKPGGIFVASEPGRGHARRSAETAKQYDVTDRDMPPVKVIRCGRAAGFRKFAIYQHADQIGSALYYHPRGSWRQWLFRIPCLKYTALLFSMFFYKRYNGIVCLTK